VIWGEPVISLQELISQNSDLDILVGQEAIAHVSWAESEVGMLAAQLPIGLDERVERNDESYYRKSWQMSVLNLGEEGRVSDNAYSRDQ
jgi:hypothetical protein